MCLFSFAKASVCPCGLRQNKAGDAPSVSAAAPSLSSLGATHGALSDRLARLKAGNTGNDTLEAPLSMSMTAGGVNGEVWYPARHYLGSAFELMLGSALCLRFTCRARVDQPAVLRQRWIKYGIDTV